MTDIPNPPLSGLALARPDQTRRTKVTNGTKMTKETHVSKALIPPRVIKIFIYTINMIRPVNGIYGLQQPGGILCLKLVIICFSLSHFCDLFLNVTMIMNICFI